MFVCVCHAVTDDKVEQAIHAGATTREAVTRSCRAGGDCGACHGHIEDMIEAHSERTEQLIASGELVRERAA
jgi:bacterioferritin-associated ferredoxin